MEKDSKFPKHWIRYLIQGSYAAATSFFITITLSNSPIIIASIGETAFIVFAMPNNIAAEPNRIIGGHFLGFLLVHVLQFSHSWMWYFLKHCGFRYQLA